MVGDYFQLTPVAGVPLYGDDNEEIHEQSYLAFAKSHFLKASVRHANDVPFQKALAEIRENKVTYDTWKLLSERCMTHPEMSQDEIDTFDHASRLYFTRNATARYNNLKLESLNKPVLFVPSEDSSVAASSAGS